MKLFLLFARLTNRNISKDWKLRDLTWTMDFCEWNDSLPWYWPPPVVTTYSRGTSFSQLYGRFRAKFQMKEDPKSCFWLLNLEKNRYLEIDQFEIFDNSVALTTWNNPHFNSQRRVPWRDTMNPHFAGKVPFMKSIYKQIRWTSPKVREYILAKPRRYEIVWRKWFVLWRIDGWPVAISFRNVPKQPMYPVVTGVPEKEIEELQVRL